MAQGETFFAGCAQERGFLVCDNELCQANGNGDYRLE